MVAILSALCLVLLGTALGRRLLRLARFRIESAALRLSFAAGLGLGVVSLAVMAIGLYGRLGSSSVHIGFLVVAALLVPDLIMMTFGAVRSVRSAWPLSFGWFEWFLVTAIALSVLSGLISSIAPPTSWDATVTHLKVPHEYLETGRIVRLDDLHSNGPMNGVMLFIPAMMLGGDTAPAVLHLSLLVLAGVALYGFARQHVGRTGSLLTAAIYFLMPIGAILGSEALVDFHLVFYLLLAVVGLVHGWQEDRTGWSILGAVCLGIALGSKYNALYALLPLCVGLGVRTWQGVGHRQRLLTEGAGVLLLAIVIGCPWYVRNVVLTGNPFYPIFARSIPTRHLSAGLTGESPVWRPPRSYPWDALNVLLYPVNHTLGFSWGVAEGPRPDGAQNSPGPLYLALVPLLLIMRPVPGWALVAVGVAALAFGQTVSTFPMFRHLMPFIVPCAAVSGRAFEWLDGRRWVRITARCTVVIVLLLQMVPFVGRTATRSGVVFGAESRAEYLRRTDDVYPMAEFAATRLGPEAKLFYVGERIYHFRALGLNATMGMPIRQGRVDFPAISSPAQLHDRLRRLGYTHVAVNNEILSRQFPPALDLIGPLVELDKLVEIEQIKELVLYEIAPLD